MATNGRSGRILANGPPVLWDIPDNWTYAPVPPEWWSGHDVDSIDVDAEPWQEAEADRLIALHGIERFAGLRVRAEDFI